MSVANYFEEIESGKSMDGKIESRISFGEERRRKVYAGQINEGFDYHATISERDVPKVKSNLENMGYEVYIGARGFFNGGAENKFLRTVYKKK